MIRKLYAARAKFRKALAAVAFRFFLLFVFSFFFILPSLLFAVDPVGKMKESSYPVLNDTWDYYSGVNFNLYDGPDHGRTPLVYHWELWGAEELYRMVGPYLYPAGDCYWDGDSYDCEVTIWGFDWEEMPLAPFGTKTVSFPAGASDEDWANALYGLWSCGGTFWNGEAPPPEFPDWYIPEQGWPWWCVDGNFPDWYIPESGMPPGLDPYDMPGWFVDEGTGDFPDDFDPYDPYVWVDYEKGYDGQPDGIDFYDLPYWITPEYVFPGYFDPYLPPAWYVDWSEPPPAEYPEAEIDYSLSVVLCTDITKLGIEYTVFSYVYGVKHFYQWRSETEILYHEAGEYPAPVLGFYEYALTLDPGSYLYRCKISFISEITEQTITFFTEAIPFIVPEFEGGEEFDPYFESSFIYPEYPDVDLDVEIEDWRVSEHQRDFDSQETLWKLLPPGHNASWWSNLIDMLPTLSEFIGFGPDVPTYSQSYILDLGTVTLFTIDLPFNFDFTSYSAAISNFRLLFLWSVNIAFFVSLYMMVLTQQPYGTGSSIQKF